MENEAVCLDALHLSSSCRKEKEEEHMELDNEQIWDPGAGFT